MRIKNKLTFWAISGFSMATIALVMLFVFNSYSPLWAATSLFPTAPAPTNGYSCASVLNHNLKLTDEGPGVFELQKILNIDVDTRVARSGNGSPGYESTYFGWWTYDAVIKFQKKYAKEILTPVGLTKGTGIVGAYTRAKLVGICSVASAGLSTEDLTAAARDGFRRAFQSYNKHGGFSVGGSTSGSGSSGGTSSSGGSTSGSAGSTSTSTRATSTPSASGSSGMATSTASSTPPSSPPITLPQLSLQWGAYVGDGSTDLSNFESLVGKRVQLYADFEGWSNPFPAALSSKVGAQGKTLVIFWEPSFGYDSIINGSQDNYIMQFALAAKSYGYPVILVPFDEMNLNEEAWGYGQNNNSAAKFLAAWKHIHDFFIGVTNVKFAIDYNNVSVPDVSGNRFGDYYPGAAYVDYVGVNGFNFGSPWQTFGQVFDSAVSQASSFGKPVYILSVASAAGIQKTAWITEGLGAHIKTYPRVVGWVWFNQNKEQNWLVDSDAASLAALKLVIPN